MAEADLPEMGDSYKNIAQGTDMSDKGYVFDSTKLHEGTEKAKATQKVIGVRFAHVRNRLVCEYENKTMSPQECVARLLSHIDRQDKEIVSLKHNWHASQDERRDLRIIIDRQAKEIAAYMNTNVELLSERDTLAETEKPQPCGERGCKAKTSRRGKERYCAQREMDGTGYCYYHQPDNPKKFGEGY